MHGVLSWPPLHHKRKKKTGRLKQENQQNVTVSKKQMRAELNSLPPGSGLFPQPRPHFLGSPCGAVSSCLDGPLRPAGSPTADSTQTRWLASDVKGEGMAETEGAVSGLPQTAAHVPIYLFLPSHTLHLILPFQ